MRLVVTAAKERHAEACTSVDVSLTGDVLSGGDDFVVRRWSAQGEALGVVAKLSSCVTCVQWAPASTTAVAARRTRAGAGVTTTTASSTTAAAAAAAGAGAAANSDSCLVGCADGSIVFVNVGSGRVERTVAAAHAGSVTALAYTADDATLLSAGEDGFVKAWSHSGVARATLASAGKCIYALCTGTATSELGGEGVLYATGAGELVLKPLNPAVRTQHKWRAHRGVVLCVDWSRMTGLIVSGGEDGVYKVWDVHGRNLYASAAQAPQHPITAVRFAADGELFAVGSFATLRVCDKTGWSCAYERVAEGSVLSLRWLPDGTQLVLGCGSGAVNSAQAVERTSVWGAYTVTLVDSRRVRVRNVAEDSSSSSSGGGGGNVHEYVQRDKVTKMELGHGHLVLCTTTTCVCYDVTRLGTQPVQFDLQDAVVTLQLAATLFVLADCNRGVQLYTYEGRPLSVLRLQAALQPPMLSSSLLAVSPDTVVLRNPLDARQLLFFDANSGKPLVDMPPTAALTTAMGGPAVPVVLTHTHTITSVHLSQAGALRDRKVAFVDRNQDLYIAPVRAYSSSNSNSSSNDGSGSSPTSGHEKLCAMVSSVAWHDELEVLTAIADGRLTTWYCPAAAFVDADLLPLTREVRGGGGAEVRGRADELARNDRLTLFHHTRVQLRRGGDGALLTFAVSPYPLTLMRLAAAAQWEGATRLCRFLRLDLLWAVLVVLALRAGELDVAETGYGALQELAKVRFLHELKNIPSPEGRYAELALLQHRPDEAERVLLQAGLVYRCIDMHTRLCNWERALRLATERKTHVDTVLARRQRYLAASGKRTETLPLFTALADSVYIDWAVIEEKVRQEVAKEAERPNARPYGAPAAVAAAATTAA